MFFLMRNWKLMIPIGALVFFFLGVDGIYVALANPRPHTMTAARFVREAPTSGWYHVTGGYLDLSQSLALTDDGRRPGYGDHAASCYIALHLPGEAPNTPVHAFVRTSDAALMQAAQAAAGSGVGSLESQITYAPAPVPKQMDVTGMVQTGLSRDSHLQRRLENTAPSVDDEFVVIADGTRPNAWKALGMLCLGLILGYGCVQMWIGDDNPFRRNAKQDDLPTQPGLGSIPYSPPGQSPPYGQPPQPPYGQAPAYGQPPPSYAQAPPLYCETPPTYGHAPPPAKYIPPPAPPAYAQAPPAPQAAPAAPPPPAKPGKTDSIPPLYDPFADQQ